MSAATRGLPGRSRPDHLWVCPRRDECKLTRDGEVVVPALLRGLLPREEKDRSAITELLLRCAAQDERTPSSALKGFLDELHKSFRNHVAQFIQWYHNQGKEGMTASRIKRQTRTIPNLISQIEELDVVIIKMANLTKKEDASAQWGAYIRRTRALDFRFIASKIEEEQENAAKKRKAKATRMPR